MKFVVKVVLAFVIWAVLGAVLQHVTPTAYRSYRMSTWATTSESGSRLTHRYPTIVTNLVAMGFRLEPEINVPTKRETRFTGTYGNITDVTIDVTLATDPKTRELRLSIGAKYTHPRWREGGSSYHRDLDARLHEMLTGNAEPAGVYGRPADGPPEAQP